MTPALPAGLSPGGRFRGWTPTDVRYVVMDVDGTLVGTSDDVRPDVVDEVRRIAGAGIPVGYATGRMQSAVDSIDAVLDLSGPHVVHNGALVRHRGQTVASWPLEPSEVASLLDIAVAHDAYAELYLDQGYLVTVMDRRASPHWHLLGLPPAGLATELGGRDVTKATFIAFDDAEAERLVAAVQDAGLAAGAAHSLLTPDFTYVNATRAAVDKGRALARAADLAGTDLAHTLAIGDGANDLPMLAVAGTAVAMGQASDLVIAASHLVTEHVDAGGLALALRALA